MPKVAIVTDSNSGITQKQGRELGVCVIPMPFMINDMPYFEDINLTQEAFYEKLSDDETILTSQPSPEVILDTWDALLKEYDEIVHIPMSSGLSGAFQSAYMLSQDYEGKVQIVNNQRISVPQQLSVLDALSMAEKGKTAKEIKEFLEEDKFNSAIYIMVDTLTYLKKGGRITPAVATIGNILKIKPILQIHGEKLDTFAKARTLSQAKSMMLNALKNDLSKHFGEISPEKANLQIAYTKDSQAAEELKLEMEKEFPGFDILMAPLSLSVSCHIGPGALGVAWCKKNQF
ncbi:MAG: DegV family protein [Lachnospiraceae bacterium]|nr:DegV family protein [Lachnospiraceae bacterium]